MRELLRPMTVFRSNLFGTNLMKKFTKKLGWENNLERGTCKYFCLNSPSFVGYTPCIDLSLVFPKNSDY